MKYFVVTTKHHEGFCLWDSKYTDYKATKTPCGKDLIKPLVQAMRGEGLRVGFYHSLLDWHHPEYTLDENHPMFGNPEFREKAKSRDMAKSREYLQNQVRELQPNIIVDDRLDLLDVPGGWDYRTPEQFMPRDWVTMNGRRVPWETCQTFSGSWGYDRDETSWKSVRQPDQVCPIAQRRLRNQVL